MQETSNIMVKESSRQCEDQRHHIVENTNGRKFIPVWKMIIIMAFIHIGAFYGLYLAFTSAHMLTIIQLLIFHLLGGFGITGGLHRLWTHRSYKAKLPLRIILMICGTLSFQGTVIHWARDHRLHHKHSDTSADPHNASNGFFFSHIGWLIRKKLPEVTREGSKLNLSDLYADPVLGFQEKYALVFAPFVAIIVPTILPMYLWGESLSNAFFVNTLRYCITLNGTCLVNSLAHLIGTKPYDENIKPRENKLVSLIALGEGFHNYHHTFPWDYKTAELGKYSLNSTTAMIDLFAKIGWAYDLKTTSEEMVRNRCSRTGCKKNLSWGWGDEDQSIEDYEQVMIRYRKND